MINLRRDIRQILKRSKRMDPLSIIATILILLIGAVTIHSAALTKKIDYGHKQLIFIVVAVIIYFIFANISLYTELFEISM